MENKKQIITVPEWFWNRIDNDIRRHGWSLVVEYKESESLLDRIDHTKLRVEEILGETEKAYKVALDAETIGGYPKEWICWIPKSILNK